MTETNITLKDIATLAVLANGIIPADDRDVGAAAVHAGPGIAERMRRSPYADVYVDGLKAARGRFPFLCYKPPRAESLGHTTASIDVGSPQLAGSAKPVETGWDLTADNAPWNNNLGTYEMQFRVTAGVDCQAIYPAILPPALPEFPAAYPNSCLMH